MLYTSPHPEIHPIQSTCSTTVLHQSLTCNTAQMSVQCAAQSSLKCNLLQCNALEQRAMQCSVPCTGGVVKSQLSPESGQRDLVPTAQLLILTWCHLNIQTLSTCDEHSPIQVQTLDCHCKPSAPQRNHAKPNSEKSCKTRVAKLVRKRCYYFPSANSAIALQYMGFA